MIDEVESLVSPTELYAKTGIQKQNFNTIYQLYADKKSGKLLNAKYFLMMPEYLSFKLTGVCKNEYTNATTTGLVNANAKTWDTDIIYALLDRSSIPSPFSSVKPCGLFDRGYTKSSRV